MLHSGEEGRQRPHRGAGTSTSTSTRTPRSGRCGEPGPRPPLWGAGVTAPGPQRPPGTVHVLWPPAWPTVVSEGAGARFCGPHAFLRPRPLRGLTRGHADLREGHPRLSLPSSAHSSCPVPLPPSSPGRAEACPARPARFSHASHPRPPRPPPCPGRAGTAWRRPGRQPLDPEVLPGASLYLYWRGRVTWRHAAAREAGKRPAPRLHLVRVLWSNEQSLRPPGSVRRGRPAWSPPAWSPPAWSPPAAARGPVAAEPEGASGPSARPGDSGRQRSGKTLWWKEGKAPDVPRGDRSQPGLPCAAREGKAGTA
ncbi:unnamed protein product [Nyctereutes procyonoides]|uniref:(raccoon dog) hypothetical protein n=1 Tax=Nyctereutes procyonoides TaxID=34880 RepID=A0A811XWQ1_NYCPR|nr:unnamed protein product [Nyctereutes procyonoides]